MSASGADATHEPLADGLLIVLSRTDGSHRVREIPVRTLYFRDSSGASCDRL